jgi:hypothetical protein
MAVRYGIEALSGSQPRSHRKLTNQPAKYNNTATCKKTAVKRNSDLVIKFVMKANLGQRPPKTKNYATIIPFLLKAVCWPLNIFK